MIFFFALLFSNKEAMFSCKHLVIISPCFYGCKYKRKNNVFQKSYDFFGIKSKNVMTFSDLSLSQPISIYKETASTTPSPYSPTSTLTNLYRFPNLVCTRSTPEATNALPNFTILTLRNNVPCFSFSTSRISDKDSIS